MIEGLYGLLETFGFTHPLHPMLVHIPMGMVIGAVLFSLVEIKVKDRHLATTAGHCALVALIFAIPTVITGILDWQYRYNGVIDVLIVIKLLLGIIITALLATVVVFRFKGVEQRKLLYYYLACLVCAGGLGFVGGELVYG